MIFRKIVTVTLLQLFLFPSLAEVSQIKITSKELILGGQEFGEYGSYELVKGTIHFQFDPLHAANSKIVDLVFAPTNSSGMVEAWTTLVILKPLDDARSRGVALVEVSNRGGKFSPRYFNRSPGSDLNPQEVDDFGIQLLMRQGLTVIWLGWQFDVPDDNGMLKLHVPIAKKVNGDPIKGIVRSDWTIDEPKEYLSLGHHNQIGYPVSDQSSPLNKLTMRSGRDAKRIEIPRSKWKFARKDDAGNVIPDPRHILLNGGFLEGFIYELVYQAQDPPIVGLGLAVIRDVISYLKYHPQSPCKVTIGIAAGVSQTGRFIRHFLYQGFNVDESGRRAYDGVMIITAGAGRGSFNHRFAQPSRDAHRYSAFFYPTDILPFSGASQFDAYSFNSQGLLSSLPKEFQPKIFYINTGYEYWGRAASLIHTTTDGTRDVNPLPNERIYHLASGQHYVDGFPPQKVQAVYGKGKFRGNPLDFSVNYRALLVALVAWVADDRLPPESRYPQIANGTLVPFKENLFPTIPGIKYPTTIHTAYRLDYGPHWMQGVIDREPPEILEEFTPMVPKVDEFGNEMGGVSNVEIVAPLATYTPWNLRTDFAGGSQELADFKGTYIPLPLKNGDKKSWGDPRPSIKSRYKNKQAFLQKVNKAAEELSEERFLLEEEIPYVIQRASDQWDWIHKKLPRM